MVSLGVGKVTLDVSTWNALKGIEHKIYDNLPRIHALGLVMGKQWIQAEGHL